MITLPQNNYTQAFQTVLTVYRYIYIYIVSVTMEGIVHAERFYTQYGSMLMHTHIRNIVIITKL